MKNLCLSLLLLLTVTAGISQTRRSSSNSTSGFSIGLEAGLPVGQYSKIYSSALGGSLQYETKPATDLGLTVSGGYTAYTLKSKYKATAGPNSTGFIPVMAGVKYYFTPGAFFHAQLGAAFGARSDQGTNFAYAPGIGVSLSPNIDAELKYSGVSNSAGSINNVGLRLAYNF